MTRSSRPSRIQALLRVLFPLALLVSDLLCLLWPARRQASGRTKVLLVRLDAIGDFVVWLDAARQFRSLYPKEQFEITLLGNGTWGPLARMLPLWDKVWSLDPQAFLNDLRYRWRLQLRIRRAGFTIALQPNYSRASLLGDSLVLMSAAPERIGSSGDCSLMRPWVKRVSDRCYTRLIPARNQPLMELERNAEFMRGLGILTARAALPRLPVPFSGSTPKVAGNYYLLFPGAGLPLRQWPETCFLEIARRLYALTGWTGVVCGGPAEASLGERMAQGATVPLKNLAGFTSLTELADTIASARIVISNETSAIHLSAAVATPSVCITGGGHMGRFVPYRLETEATGPLPEVVAYDMDCRHCDWHCLVEPAGDRSAPCIEQITVDAVWSSVLQVLEPNNRDKDAPL